jgi:hypothetical protein
MSRDELELAYLRAMQDLMTEEYNTRMLVRDHNPSGFEQQTAKEEEAFKRYQKAQRAFLNAPKE